MKYYILFFLAACCLLLGGCSELPSPAVGPQGGGEPLPLNEQEPMPRNALPERPMGRRRRNAAQGRLVSPGNNSAGGGAWPAWLYIAQKQDGLYLGANALSAPAASDAPRLRFFPHAAQARAFAAANARGQLISPAGLFADWCLAQAGFPRLGANMAAAAENWLNYGASAAPCLGALMVAEEGGRYCPAFCAGALTLPLGPARTEPIYLGLGVRPNGAGEGCQIGLVAFAASQIAAFRLPLHYRPGKEDFKLDYTPWAEQFRAKLARRQKQQMMEQADTAPAALAALDNLAAPQADALATPNAAAAPAAPNIAAAANAFTVEDELAAALEHELAGQDFSAGGGLSAPAAAPQYQRRPANAPAEAAFYPAEPAADLLPPLRRYI